MHPNEFEEARRMIGSYIEVHAVSNKRSKTTGKKSSGNGDKDDEDGSDDNTLEATQTERRKQRDDGTNSMVLRSRSNEANQPSRQDNESRTGDGEGARGGTRMAPVFGNKTQTGSLVPNIINAHLGMYPLILEAVCIL